MGFRFLLRKEYMAYIETITTKGTAMFKGIAVQSKLVRTKKQDGDLIDLHEVMPKIDLPSKETVQEVSHDVIKKTAFAVVGVIVAAAVVRTASEIVIHHATK